MTSQYRKPLPNSDLEYFDTRQAVNDITPDAYDKLPYTSRILAEQLVRKVSDPNELTAALKQLINRERTLDFPWYPARVVCHDILGQTALVDLAGLRDAIAEQGGDPSKVNPVVQTQLIVDHSLAVECGGYDPDAFEKNRAIEDRRNEDRFHFIDWTKLAFKNVDVIPAGNGIMHQINLEKMSPVIQAHDGVAYPDTCVGTDSHTPHVDALGVIAIGVGGLEAENVMLGRASWMRLPDIVGVELTGQRQPGITATDIVLALTEFLRRQKVVGAYLEFYGEGASKLTLGDRATISNMAPEYGATAAMFSIDDNTLDYLRLTGRSDEQVKLVETYAKAAGLWSDTLKNAEYERVLRFDLSSVVRNMAGPSNPHARVATTDLAAKGIAGKWEETPGQMPDGAVIIAAITSCTNTSNPRNVIAAALLARNANRLGLTRKPWVKSSLAPGSKAVELYLEEAGLKAELEKLGFGYDDVRKFNDRVVYVSISGFGPDGPRSGQRVYDNVIQAASGLASVQTDKATGRPQVFRTLVCDKVTSYTVAQAVTAALFARERGRGGQHIEISMLDSAIAFMWPDSAMDAALLDDDVARTPTIGENYAALELKDGFVFGLTQNLRKKLSMH